MEKTIKILGLLVLFARATQNSVLVKKSDAGIYSHKSVLLDKKQILNYEQTVQPKLELIIEVKNFSQILSHEKKKHRREKFRNRKEKGGKLTRQKHKTQKPTDYVDKQILRNNEKVNLVRNRTMEILKNGIRILSPGENRTQNKNNSTSRGNETLMEKILSSTASKSDVLLSTRGTYKVPIGVEIYETKTLSPEKQVHHDNYPTQTPEDAYRFDDDQNVRKQNKKGNKSLEDIKDYDYDYDSVLDFNSNINATREQKSFKPHSSEEDYEYINRDYNLAVILTDIVSVLRNLSNCPKGDCSESETSQKSERNVNLEDPCQKWLDCKDKLEHVFFSNNSGLPSCPCTYPSVIFYNESIWDENYLRYFRWRDASGESERLDIYKPGASYCIRSLLTPGSSSISSQQCCYDKKLQLITRGSGVGTVNFVSPDVSKRLHDIVDILPWKLCKGDFTRYNLARKPNNGNNCLVNPDEEQYQLQVKLSKIF